MVKATARCICSYCGIEFEVSQKRKDRAEAESWKDWVEANCDICPACYSKQKQKTAEEKLAGYNLPEIEAASKKQKAYACKLRARFVAKNEEKIDYVNRVIKISKTDGYRKKCEDIGESPELYFERNIINNIVYRSAYICLTETNAGKVVDELAL